MPRDHEAVVICAMNSGSAEKDARLHQAELRLVHICNSIFAGRLPLST